MEWQGIDQLDGVPSHGSWHLVGQLGASALVPLLGGPLLCLACPDLGSGALPSCLGTSVAAQLWPAMMGLLRAVHTVGRGVKSLDPHEMNGSEGVQQAYDRRSRTRVWGSKMIRYRRSPLPSTMPAWPEVGASFGRPALCRPHYRETKACGFRGEYGRKAET